MRDGAVIEGSHSNFFVVLEGDLTTFPESPYILPGVTRRLVLELAVERLRLEPSTDKVLYRPKDTHADAPCAERFEPRPR